MSPRWVLSSEEEGADKEACFSFLSYENRSWVCGLSGGCSWGSVWRVLALWLETIWMQPSVKYLMPGSVFLGWAIMIGRFLIATSGLKSCKWNEPVDTHKAWHFSPLADTHKGAVISTDHFWVEPVYSLGQNCVSKWVNMSQHIDLNIDK